MSLADADLIVGADGVNSLVRKTFGDEFGASLDYLTNRFAWFGTTKTFDTLTQTFRHTPIGNFNAHHYRYAPGRSTFIVEVDEATFVGAGLERMDDADARALCEKVFADALGRRAADLQQFGVAAVSAGVERALASRQARADRRRAAHRALLHWVRHAARDGRCHRAGARSVEHGDDVAKALSAFEAARGRSSRRSSTAPMASASWYEHFAEHMQLAPWISP